MPLLGRRARGLHRHARRQALFIELNSIPGMSAGSIVPKQVRAMGMTVGELFDIIIADTCRK